MKHKKVFFAVTLIFLQFCTGPLWGRSTTMDEARQVVTGWLKADAQPLNAAIGQQVMSVEAFTNDVGELIYYIVYLEPSGFVVVSADNLVEPIIAFVEEGAYDPSPDNPLGALVTKDLNSRIAAVRNAGGIKAAGAIQAVSGSQAKWDQLMNLGGVIGTSGVTGLLSVSDPRVDPLVKSKWGQTTCCAPQGDPCALACYNYYTPPSDPCDPCDYLTDPNTSSPYPYGDPDNFPCGCVATAMAQLMRYHTYPVAGIGKNKCLIDLSYAPWWEYAWTRGGDGLGGPYNWSLMVDEPNCSTTQAGRQAIGALCYDAGIAAKMSYSPTASGAYLSNAAIALRNPNIFNYSNAVYSAPWPSIPAVIDMVNPNLDYNHPVIIAVSESPDDEMGHAVVADGYGYNLSTLYHHLNMGWDGDDNAWYNLPFVKDYNVVTACIYNVFTSGTGEIISGRVTDAVGVPISGAAVIVLGPGGPHNATTNSRGIYALAHLPSASTYTISVSGYSFAPQIVNTGTSSDSTPTSGNVWGVDFPPAASTVTVVYVDGSAPGNDDGSDWCNAYNYLQDALGDPCASEIRVADGTYRPDTNSAIGSTGDRNASFVLRSGVAVYGGYAGYGAADPNERDTDTYKTILSGDLSDNDVFVFELWELITAPTRAENCYHVVTGSFTDETAILDGCIITAGNANGIVWPHNEGGGMFNNNANCTVNKCTFVENTSRVTGGAMANNGSSLQVSKCIFFRNAGALGGGGISSYQSSPTVVNCSFISNMGTDTGNNAGGLYNRDQSHTMVMNCLFMNNSADYGGGVANINGSSPTIDNCTFYKNQATGGDGGIHDYNNCFPVINNCILWDNTSQQVGDDASSAATVNYSDVQGGWSGAGISNINTNPCFMNPNGPDGTLGTLDDAPRLSPSSPCTDRGNNTFVPADATDLDIDDNTTEQTPLDLDGHHRFADGDLNGSFIVDMGAYETALVYSGDLNEDRTVNFIDFAILAEHWLETFEVPEYIEEDY